jgi:hypothetical protein
MQNFAWGSAKHKSLHECMGGYLFDDCMDIVQECLWMWDIRAAQQNPASLMDFLVNCAFLR